MKRILLPANGEVLGEEFSKSQLFRVYHVSENVVRKEELVDTSNLRSQTLPAWISKKKITDVIADKMEREMLDQINRSKINVFVGVKPKKTAQIIEDLMSGRLETEDNRID